jgi:hypothetical protein
MLAERQLERALRDPSERRCAVALLRQIAAGERKRTREAGGAGSYSHCDAGKALLEEDLTDAAKKQYEKVLEADPPDPCGVAGLSAVDEAEEEQKEDDDKLSPGEAMNDLGDLLERHGFWVLLFAVVAVGWLVFRSERIAVQASKDDEELGNAVVAAANAAGYNAPLPSRVASAPPQKLPGDELVALSKMVKLPATAVIEAVMKLVAKIPGTSSRLDVRSFAAGGSVVIELDLRRTLKRKRTARIVVPLGGDEPQRKELLGLVGGLWLVGHMAPPNPNPVIQPDNADAVIFHACFGAAAYRYARGDVAAMRACHAAMPKSIEFEHAPFAWLGARLNEMMALKTERRWGEAARMADVVGDYPGTSEALAPYGEPAVQDLLRRRRYMTAVMRVDHFYALTLVDDPERRESARTKAVEAVAELDQEADPVNDDAHDVVAIRAAIRMVRICFQIADVPPVWRSLEDVQDELDLSAITPSRPLPILTGAAYYDAACAAVMLGLQELDQDSREKLYVTAIQLLATAMLATAPARRPRVRAMAKLDDMLKPIRGRDEFAVALGEDAKPEAKPEPAGLTD